MHLYDINVILHTIYQEMAMHDDLAKNEKYKKDREIDKHKLITLENLVKEINKLSPDLETKN